MEKVHILVKGQVQGVAFRAYTLMAAQQLHVNGFVRNLQDGSVEILAEGDRGSLEKLIEWAYNGSPVARVDDVQVSFSEATGKYDDFQVRV